MTRRALDLSLYLITDTRLCGAVGVPATVAAAVGAGVSAVQVRDPEAGDDEFVLLGRSVAEALQGLDIPLIVNDRVHLVAAIGADGAHIGQHDLDPHSARELLGPDAVLGLSVQTVDQVTVARREGADLVDYLGVGPVWPQATKPDAAEPSGLDRLRDITAISPWPCVAIGGVDADRAAQARRHGAAGVAVVSAICGRPDVAAATLRIKIAWDSAAWDRAAET
jgi:thiamine-phosphate pyrophosphorylase